MLTAEVVSMKTWFWVSIYAAASVACGAPRAAPIGGDIATVIEHSIEAGTARFDHSTWDELLQKHTKMDGRRFDYAGLKHDESRFDDYLAAIASVDLATLSSPEIQALFANAYNAYTIKTILDHVGADGSYAIASIQDVPEVFSRKVHTVGGFELSLDNMEHNVLRPMFKDPRFHFAVNCASMSCPPLPMRAFTGEQLEDQLEAVTRHALQNPDYVTVDGDALLVTKILEWYGSDFTNPEYRGSERTLPAFIAKYATDDVSKLIAARGGSVDVKFRDYDWRLNNPQ